MQLLLGRLLEHGSAEKEIYSVFRDPYGIHCLIPMLLLQVPILYMNVHRASLGRRFCEDRVVGPPTVKCGLCRITSMYIYRTCSIIRPPFLHRSSAKKKGGGV